MAQLTQSNRSGYQGKNSDWTRTASLATDLGDATYLVESTGKISPASSFPDQGDEASTQRAFAALFAGLAGSTQAVTETTSKVALQYTRLEIELTCTSTTFAMGDYVAPAYSAGNLSDNAYVKVTDPSRAIGKVTKPYAAATTTVWCLVASPLFDFRGADSQSSETVTGQPGVAAGDAGGAIVYQGGEGADHVAGAAGAGGAATWKGGPGGGVTSGTAGVGGNVVIGGAAGGAATTGTPAAGGDTDLVGGAGGAASAGTGNGGAGGNINLTPGAGGTSFGGTAGTRGLVIPRGLVAKAGTTAVAIAGATTLVQADSGGVFTVSQAAAYDVDLPSPTTGPGLSFLFSVTAPGANNVTITVLGGAATFVGSIVTEGQIIVATGSTLTIASGAAVIGDSIEIRSISTSLYHVRAISSILNGITVA